MYPESEAPVYCDTCYSGDGWDPYAVSRDIDWSKPFLLQLKEIFNIQPRIFQYRIGTVVNSDYGNSVVNSKDAYFAYSVIDSEHVAYSENIDKSRDTFDCLSVQKLDQCSWNINSEGNYNCHYVIDSENCIDSFFLFDCVNCQNCCLSTNQRNQQYVFKNQKLTKEAYQQALQELNLSTFSGFSNAQKEYNSLCKNAIHRYANILSSENVSGDLISNSKNIDNSFDIKDAEQISNSYRIIKAKDLMDCCWSLSGELSYESLSPSGNAFKQNFSVLCLGSKDMNYSLFCKNCSDCFGCVGLKNAKYCILNKQYSKEEYFVLIEKIKKHMSDAPYVDEYNRVYSYGEFLPYCFSPYAYNETVAHDFFPLTKADAERSGYNWKDREKRDYAISTSTDQLPDAIEDVTDDILTQTIGCPNNGNAEFQCTSAYRITADELQFYKQKGLPLPRKCPNCRHYERLAYRNQNKLYTRGCMFPTCGNTFETTYAPDRTEKVYCETCYKREVL
jgi:hypothetical protein